MDIVNKAVKYSFKLIERINDHSNIYCYSYNVKGYWSTWVGMSFYVNTTS